MAPALCEAPVSICGGGARERGHCGRAMTSNLCLLLVVKRIGSVQSLDATPEELRGHALAVDPLLWMDRGAGHQPVAVVA